MLRFPAVAGAFYPDDPQELTAMISDFLARAKPPEIEGRLRALIVPHAGYVYSGPVAAFGYSLVQKLIRNSQFGVHKFLLLGPTHTVGFAGAALSTADEWETPLGRVSLWRPDRIDPPFFDFDLAHSQEHCLEVQLPFLQCIYDIASPDTKVGAKQSRSLFSILPLILGETDPEEIARGLESWLDEQTLIIVSSDLSHYHPYNQAVDLDKTTIEAILKKQFTILETQGQACGMLPILALLHLAKKLDWQGQLLDYRNSGDTAGDKSRVVGYAAIAFSSKIG